MICQRIVLIEDQFEQSCFCSHSYRISRGTLDHSYQLVECLRFLTFTIDYASFNRLNPRTHWNIVTLANLRLHVLKFSS